MMANKPAKQNLCKALICAFGPWSHAYRPVEPGRHEDSSEPDTPAVALTVKCLAAADIEHFILAATPENLPNFQAALEDGSELGVKVSYLLMGDEEGLISALAIAGEFIAQSSVAIVSAGFYEFRPSFRNTLRHAIMSNPGATILTRSPVNDFDMLPSCGLVIADRRSQQFARNVLEGVGGRAGPSQLLNQYQSIDALKQVTIDQ